MTESREQVNLCEEQRGGANLPTSADDRETDSEPSSDISRDERQDVDEGEDERLVETVEGRRGVNIGL